MALTWATLYDQAVTLFGGQRPTRQLETLLVEHFTRRPDIVQDAITRIGDRYTADKVHSPWGLIQRELEHDQHRAQIAAAPNAHDRDRQTRLAETYIRNAGLYFPSEAELVDDLFGAHGKLRAWSHDEHLKQRMVALWQQQQPRAQQAEHDAVTRAEKWKATRTLAEERATIQPSVDLTPHAQAAGLLDGATETVTLDGYQDAAQPIPEDAGPPDPDTDQLFEANH